METCWEREVTGSGGGAVSPRMSPIPIVMDPVGVGSEGVVIVLGGDDNTWGVSVRMGSFPAGGGCPPGW